MMIVPSVLFVRNPADRLMHQAGVPRELWNMDIHKIHFVSTSIWGARFDPKAQRRAVMDYVAHTKSRNKNPRQPARSFFAVVSSEPTGAGAQAFGAALVRMIVDARMARRREIGIKVVGSPGLTFAFINVASWVRPKVLSEREPEIVVLHGVYDNSSDVCVETTRQILNYYYGTVRILAVAGVQDPEKWSLTKLRIRPHIVYKVKDVDLTSSL